MKKALDLLDHYCQDYGIQRVAATRLGYEDEGPVLSWWRATEGPSDASPCIVKAMVIGSRWAVMEGRSDAKSGKAGEQ